MTRTQEEQAALDRYAAEVAQLDNPQPYRDAATGAVCTCGRVIGLASPRNGTDSIPHAEDCPVRKVRAKNSAERAIAHTLPCETIAALPSRRQTEDEAVAELRGYLTANGLTVTRSDNCPPEVPKRPCITTDTVRVTGPGVALTIMARTTWDHGDAEGLRYLEDPLDIAEHKAIDARGVTHGVAGDIPPTMIDIASSCRAGQVSLLRVLHRLLRRVAAGA